MGKHPPIQVVDENDNPVGGASFDEVYQRGLNHRIVRVMVEDGNGNVLLQKRAAGVRTYAGYWDNSAAGHVDKGESYEQAAKRELFEELGFKGVLKELGTYQTNRQIGNNIMNRFNRVYKTSASRDFHFNFPKNEISQVMWLSIEQAKNLAKNSPGKVADGLVDILKRYY